MKQASLKLKTYTNNINIVDNSNLKMSILNVMLWILGVLVLAYIFFLGNMIFNIVERNSLERYVRTLSNDVGNLELEYLSLSQKIDVNFAYSLGFKETKAKFVTRKILGSLNIIKNEI